MYVFCDFVKASVPVEFIIDCRNELVASLGQSSLSDYFSTTFGVLLRFYPKIDGINCQVNIRGQQDRIALLKESVTYFGRVTHTLLVRNWAKPLVRSLTPKPWELLLICLLLYPRRMLS